VTLHQQGKVATPAFAIRELRNVGGSGWWTGVQYAPTLQAEGRDAMPEQDIEFDIPARLRKWAGVVPVPPAVSAMEDAAYEVERLQRELTRAWAAARLTDAEREAIQTAMNAYGDNNDDRECEMIEATLWRLLERTKCHTEGV